MSDSDVSGTADTERESHLVGCSVRGPSHEEEETPCQDDWAGTQLSDSRFALAVADGLGSASHSHKGSEVASETAVEYLKDVLTDRELTEEILRDTLETAFTSARSALQDEADRQGVSIKDLNTTLLVAAGGPSGVAAAAVGDGGVIRVYRDEFHLFVPREDSEYANRTTPVQSDHWEESYRFEYSENVDGVAAFSDGLENVAWDGKEQPQAALFEQFFNFVWYTTDEERINKELSEFLNHERYRSISGDDKTIAIATLNVDYENREPLLDIEQSESTDRSQVTSVSAASSRSGADYAPESSNTDSETEEESGINAPNSYKSTSTSANPETNESTEVANERQPDEYESEVLKADGTTIHLNERVNVDQTGVVYSTHGDQYPTVKVFERDSRGEAQKEKIEAMVGSPAKTPRASRDRDVRLQWPAAVLTDYSEKTFLGCAYTISVPRSGQTIRDFAHSENADETLGSRVGSFIESLKEDTGGPGVDRYETAIDFAATVNALHNQNIAMCDFDPDKIIITDSELYFTLCDSYAFNSGPQYYPPTGVQERYFPQRGVGESINDNQYTDRFGLAVHLYRLLVNGTHPFGLPNEKSRDDLLEPEQLNPHIRQEPGEIASGASNGMAEAEQYAELPRMIRYHFEQCFIEGFDAPVERPSARQWVEVLTEERG